MTTSRQVHLAGRPSGWPMPEHFSLRDCEIPPLCEGEVRVRNTYLSVDPWMRGRMNSGFSYAEPYRIGEALWGTAVGEVVKSESDILQVGDTVVHELGWREHAWGPAGVFRRVNPTGDHGQSLYLGVLGRPGLSAYVGLLDIARHQPGDVVFVSAGAGTVGSLVGQIAKLRGSRVIGSAGSDRKVTHLVEDLHFDAAFNYHTTSPHVALRDLAPEGIDVYFDNVGGVHLEAAIDNMCSYGRIAACGAISGYNTTGPVLGPSNLFEIIARRLTMQGFISWDHLARRPSFETDVGRWLTSGEILHHETIIEGIENTPAAFIDMLKGSHIGKVVVRVD